jgi:predicted aspartyl protease
VSKSSRCFLLPFVCGWLLTGMRAQETLATIPMEIRHHMPVIPVMVNGQGPFHFAIDTGSGTQLLVSADLSQRLELAVTGEDELSDPSGANKQKVPVFRINSLKLAGIEFKSVPATQLTDLRKGESFDGVLGFGLFRDYLLTLDFPNQQVVLVRGTLPPPDGKEIIPFRSPDNIPVIVLSIAGQEIDAHIDSGGMGLSLPEEFANKLTFTTEPMVLGRGRTVSNDFEIKGAQLASEVRLGGYTFPRPFVEINPIFPVVNFGSIPLAHFAVTFDQKNQRVRFVADDRTIVIAPPKLMGPMQPQSATSQDHGQH